MLRSHTNGQLNKKDVNKNVVLAGWVDSLRLHGKIGFVNIRDRYGLTQLFIDEKLINDASKLNKEDIILVKGKVNERPKNQINKDLSTGEIEVKVNNLEIINKVKELPLDLSLESNEETRLKYRYLDLRRKNMQHNIITRHKIIKAIRDFMDKENFLEIETPILAKSTPEGARDYLVPSRLYKGKFYALPQSPQLFKQLLMVAGFDRYFQIVKCFRDEDLRADRQPEFTQLDVEMSFINEEDIYSLFERMFKYVWKNVLDVDIKIPFPRMGYDEAIKKYKTDKPDLRKNKNEFAFVWITDFPMLEYNKEEKRWKAMHHPFTMPEDINELEKNPGKVKARAYDLVLNGSEIGGGSIRINKKEIQERVFKVLGIDKKEANDKFGFLLNALDYCPVIGGIAFGIDRIVTIATNNDSIKEVIAFPKNKDAKDLMLDSPSNVDKEQLKEIGLK